MKIGVPLGVRPNIVKLAPVIHELSRRNLEFEVVHTGQHYDKILSDVFFECFDLEPPKINLGVGSGSQGHQIGMGIAKLSEHWEKNRPDIVLAHGDSNMAPAAVIAATKLGIHTIHKEAGLRSKDKSMPEEGNRLIADHLAEGLCTPTNTSKSNLLKENIPKEIIKVTGNTIVDSVHYILPQIKEREDKVAEEEYFLLTLHRPENVDNKNRFTEILLALEEIKRRYETPIVFPLHPRTKKRIDEFDLEKETNSLKIIEPLDYLDFLKAATQARLILTDSGGLQEESCILGKPCVTIRENTERPESIQVGANYLAGCKKEGILAGVKEMLDKKPKWENPFGNGHAAEKIVDYLLQERE